MSTVDDVQLSSLNNAVGTDQPKIGVITHQPPPAYTQINTQPMQTLYQNPPGPVYCYQNGEMIPVTYVHSGMNGHYPIGENSGKIKLYINIFWATCNICCCFCLLGIVALIVSLITMRMKKQGNYQGARCGMIWATIVNILATITGIILIILISLQYIQLSKP